jgi:hypothetical protein
MIAIEGLVRMGEIPSGGNPFLLLSKYRANQR